MGNLFVVWDWFVFDDTISHPMLDLNYKIPSSLKFHIQQFPPPYICIIYAKLIIAILNKQTFSFQNKLINASKTDNKCHDAIHKRPHIKPRLS